MLRKVIIVAKLFTTSGNLPQMFKNPHNGKPQAQKNNKPEQIQNAGLLFRFTYLGIRNNS